MRTASYHNLNGVCLGNAVFVKYIFVKLGSTIVPQHNISFLN